MGIAPFESGGASVRLMTAGRSRRRRHGSPLRKGGENIPLLEVRQGRSSLGDATTKAEDKGCLWQHGHGLRQGPMRKHV